MEWGNEKKELAYPHSLHPSIPHKYFKEVSNETSKIYVVDPCGLDYYYSDCSKP
jgi:hypothetical protein